MNNQRQNIFFSFTNFIVKKLIICIKIILSYFNISLKYVLVFVKIFILFIWSLFIFLCLNS